MRREITFCSLKIAVLVKLSVRKNNPFGYWLGSLLSSSFIILLSPIGDLFLLTIPRLGVIDFQIWALIVWATPKLGNIRAFWEVFQFNFSKGLDVLSGRDFCILLKFFGLIFLLLVLSFVNLLLKFLYLFSIFQIKEWFYYNFKSFYFLL